MKVPILIYSFNRPRYLDRILSYYQKQNYDQHLILADGSEKQWPGAEKFKGKYLHLPSVSFRERLIAGLEQSESDLAVLCADDDFLVPAGFEACVEFLRNNPDYACAQGQYGRFVINEDEISYSQKHAGAQSIVDYDPLERVKKAFIPKYIPHIYAVHRRKNLERIIDYQEMNDFEYLFNFEIFLTFSSLLDGKAKRLPIIYNFREMENIKVGINNNKLNINKIKGVHNKCNLYLIRLAEDQTNKDDVFDLINMATENLLEYHLTHYNHRLSKNNSAQKTSDNIMFYLSKLKNPTSWVKILNPHTLSNVFSNIFLQSGINSKNSFPLNDAGTIKEFKIIDDTLKNWIDYMKINVPEN